MALSCSARVVFCGVHLLERENRYADAIHYLSCLLEWQRHACCLTVGGFPGEIGPTWQRYAMDLDHIKQHELALQS
jgi:hypothetical protein